MAKVKVGINQASGPLLFMSGVKGVSYGEIVEVVGVDGVPRIGQVLETSDEAIVVQVFGGTEGLPKETTTVRFLGKPFEVEVSKAALGRIFNGLGQPIDGYPYHGKEARNINGFPINPASREYPEDYIETGISTIDGLNTLVRGQKLPVFSGSGLPHNRLVAQIVRQARVREGEIAIVFGAMGVRFDDAVFFRKAFEEQGVLEKVVSIINLAEDPAIERLLVPRIALTFAEHLAFDHGFQVLVVLTDMTNYAEALREISSAREEVPGRKGYPGYLYSDLASIYERAGRIENNEGSVTQVPVLTMPNDDITHPIPDLTGYITEGQIVLDRNLHAKGIYPPINPLPSLSRLMKDGIGKGKTREDHPYLANQLYAAYAYVQQVRSLASIIGEEELSATDKSYLSFGERFEREFIAQRYDENRTIEQTLDMGWKILRELPVQELSRIPEELIEKFMNREMS